jgi:ABC-type transport system involved in multi-copper enzyme maturation permease subunit
VNVVRAELVKALTTRLLLWFALGLVGFLGLVVSIHVGSSDRFSLATESTQRSVVQAAGLAAVAAVLVGALLVTTEYNHGTINQSFLAVPARERLLAAKLVAALLVTAALAVVGAFATVVIAAIWYEGRGETLVVDGTTLPPLLGSVGASVLAAAIGLGLGTLLRRQTAATVLVLLWLLIGENIIGLIAGAARYAPGHVLAAVVVAHRQGTPDALGLWPAVIAGLVYGAALCAAGFVVVSRSDVPSTGG